MFTNFAFLKGQEEYALFAPACMEAERVLATSAAMAAVGTRKALELAVKWVYAADNTITMPYRDNLQSLIHEPSFRFAVEDQTWQKLPYIIKLGNLAVHTGKTIDPGEAILSLAALFEFIQWLDYCYGANYEERFFQEGRIPRDKVVVDEARVRAQRSLIEQQEAQIAALEARVEAMSERLTAAKGSNQGERQFIPGDISEFLTRKKYIDLDLKSLGWVLGADVQEEVELVGMPNREGSGRADYVLYGKDKLPLALIEAKRTSRDPRTGTQQARLYADCLEQMTGRRPLMFTTNGFETYLWDDLTAPQRRVSGVFAKSDMEKLIQRRGQRRVLREIAVNDQITDRYYQKEAIRAVCEALEEGRRKALLVMATGTGKTRTACSLTDVLSRGGYITNTLFLADRTALVRQARDAFKNHLPDMSLCNLLDNKDDKSARIVFSTYPTMLNSIDEARNDTGQRLFTPAHFDLIIIDEAHRSIFRKYRTIFTYFDALLLGLTATPKDEVERNTYEFFAMENGVPTYAYDYETAVEKDRVLVPFYNIEVRTKFLEEGIVYDDLSAEDKARYEKDFADEEGDLPEFIPSPELNKYIFNQDTVDMVLEDLMTKGIKVGGGDRLGKTIVFAQNRKHAAYIVERFDQLFPHYHGKFARRVVHDDNYVQTTIDDFKVEEKEPHIAVSVDMLDTGVDIPELVNLVFFKRVRSKTKFWQMIGRGTRLCPDLFGAGRDKTHFVIFDYLGNFEFFRQETAGLPGQEAPSLTEAIFAKRVGLIHHLQHAVYSSQPYRAMRGRLIGAVGQQINALSVLRMSVKLQLQHVEKFKDRAVFTCLTERDKGDLITYLGPLVHMDDNDEYAKRFDNFMYGLMLAQVEGRSYEQGRRKLCGLCRSLAQRATIPHIQEKLVLINTISSDEFWPDADILKLEKVRGELRSLIKFIVEPGREIVYTALTDQVLEVKEGEEIGPAYDFTDYRLKVNRYIEENRDHMAIHKLRHNIPLTALDYRSLERIFTGELGTAEDYQREFRGTPFGLLVRKVARLEHEAACLVFSEFINDQSLSREQIVFVRKVIDYVVQNGYIENVAELTQPPFDRPRSFLKLFDEARQKRIVELVRQIKDNAVKIVG